METRLARVVLVSLLVMISLGASGCPGFSCSIPTTSTTARTAAPVSTTTTAAPTTTTSSSTTTSTTSTTLSALERYRAAMRVWVDTYGAGLSQAYSVISGANLLNPTPAQVQATKDLDLAHESNDPGSPGHQSTAGASSGPRGFSRFARKDGRGGARPFRGASTGAGIQCAGCGGCDRRGLAGGLCRSLHFGAGARLLAVGLVG